MNLNAASQAQNALARDRYHIAWNVAIEPGCDFTPGFEKTVDPIFGERFVQNGWKITTSSWVLCVCEPVKVLPIKLPGFPDSHLAVTRLHDPEGLKKAFGVQLPPFWCQPFHKLDRFPFWNWGPMYADTLEGINRFRKGWN